MRKLKGFEEKFIYIYVLLMGVFHLFTATTGSYEAYLQRTIHLTWILPLAFVLYPMWRGAPKDRVPIYDWLLGAAATIPGIYGIVNYTALTERIQQVDPLTTAQMVLGILLVVLLLEGTRRVVGLPLACIGALFILYMIYGHSLPGILQGLHFPFEQIVEQLFLTDEGIFSMPLGVSATFVMIFLIFGGFLEKSGAGAWFMDVAQAFTGTAPGGPAQIAVISSCLFGSISGSAVANVYGTGSFTIPLMKKIGYAPYFAGAVEAVASSGGQIMPPIMGAGAFLMASFLGLQYREIMISAIFPALLYYGAVFVMVRLRALKTGLHGLSPEELPSKSSVLKRLYMIAPIAGLVYFLLVGATPMRAALIGILLAWYISFFDLAKASHVVRVRAIAAAVFVAALTALLAYQPELLDKLTFSIPTSGRPMRVDMLFPVAALAMLALSLCNPGMGPRDVIAAVHNGAKGIVLVCVACATAGTVLGSVALTGIGGKLVGFVIAWAGNTPFLALVLVMLISLVLGMGLPTTGAYILAAALGAPILQKLGFNSIASHMFVFYYAIISNITPPVALAAYAASSIAGSDPNRTGFQAMQLGFLAFIVPFAFCYDPGILMHAAKTAGNIWAIVSGIAAMFAFAFTWMGYITAPIPLWMRCLLFAAGVLCLTPMIYYMVVGIAITVGCYLYSKKVLTARAAV